MLDEPFELPIEDILDLHSVPHRDAQAIVEAYLECAYNKGFKGVRIIHGRGIGARREMVRKVLASTVFVTSFTDAPAEAGGWGATVVNFCDSKMVTVT
jgi:dsDNA-specific endonuclease/ATPase MutS2